MRTTSVTVRSRLFNHPLPRHHSHRSFHSLPSLRAPKHLPKPSALPPLPVLPASSYTEAFLRGSGPGGQKINKTSSAVQLIHTPTGIVVKCQATRSRAQNRSLARRMLAERIEELEVKGGVREVSRRGVREERARRKKKSSGKKSRRKYRALAEGKEGGADAGEEGEDGGEEGDGDEEDEEDKEDEDEDEDGMQLHVGKGDDADETTPALKKGVGTPPI